MVFSNLQKKCRNLKLVINLKTTLYYIIYLGNHGFRVNLAHVRTSIILPLYILDMKSPRELIILGDDKSSIICDDVIVNS